MPAHRWEPTDAQRETAGMLWACGFSDEVVAQKIGIGDRKVVAERLREVKEAAAQLLKNQIMAKLVQKALKDGNTPCLIFLAKNLLGMADNPNDPRVKMLVDAANNPGAPPLPREEYCIRVIHYDTGDPRAFPRPPQHLLLEAYAEDAVPPAPATDPDSRDDDES